MAYVLSGLLGLLVLVFFVMATVDGIIYIGYPGDYANSIINHSRMDKTGIDVTMLKGLQLYVGAGIAAYVLLWGGFRAFRK